MNPEHEQSIPLQEKVTLLVSPENENIEDLIEQTKETVTRREEELRQAALGLPENTPEEKLEKQNFLHQIERVAQRAITQLRAISLLWIILLASPAFAAEETSGNTFTQKGEQAASAQTTGVVSTAINTLTMIAKSEADSAASDAAQAISGLNEKGEKVGRVNPALDLAERLPINIGNTPVSGVIGTIKNIRDFKEHGSVPIIVGVVEGIIAVYTGPMGGMIASFLGDKITEHHERTISAEAATYVDGLIKNIYPSDDKRWEVISFQPADTFLAHEKFFSEGNIIFDFGFSPSTENEAYAPLDSESETGMVRTLLKKMNTETGVVPGPKESVKDYLYRAAHTLVIADKTHPEKSALN